MPALPWTAVGPPPAGEVLVMASRFRVARFRHVLPFFLDALRVHAQVRKAHGVLGLALDAHPLRREFLTLSAWRDRESLDAMVGAQPHRAVMARYREATEESAFTFWTAPADALPVSWDDARARLTAA
ncbi:DUF3291 domain-containing protein [Pseudonocardia broussonetiae]|uniref:DUF3291 domain-containing protein n=1 Tax=Pseudonocardia broussonetiae TaxID=2736640 RepID=A0A6M6JG05_9PSEU|nr:DUF3291 domain-containing protein [Pseudonocardia broussonetiae]QJY46053.1 DUF3291 domain-containing protein [Pseudonocardia broussonetiae]